MLPAKGCDYDNRTAVLLLLKQNPKIIRLPMHTYYYIQICHQIMQGSTSSKVWAYCMSANQVIAMEIGSGSSASTTAWTAKCDNSNHLAGSAQLWHVPHFYCNFSLLKEFKTT